MSVRYAAAYFVGNLTVKRRRPFFRRRLRTARPHLVSIRARNPCVRMRRLFRGRYVGLPIHELQKSVQRRNGYADYATVILSEKKGKSIQQMETYQGVRRPA